LINPINQSISKSIIIKNAILSGIIGITLFGTTVAHAQKQPNRYIPKPYNPSSEPLYQTIVKLDKLYFDTYNHCKLDKMAERTAEDIEFYHDRGGLTTSKKELIESIQKHLPQSNL